MLLFLSAQYLYLDFSYSEPRVYFDQTRYLVDENSDICEVTVKRAGSDLFRPSMVVIRSKKTNPVSAKGMGKFKPEHSFSNVRHLFMLGWISSMLMLAQFLICSKFSPKIALHMYKHLFNRVYDIPLINHIKHEIFIYSYFASLILFEIDCFTVCEHVYINMCLRPIMDP